MLEIKKISKTYITGDLRQEALKEVSLNFRNSEFVSILGPSGSGKTTLLNIIGGLDHYDDGDLIINSISTKKYKSKDWDSYRNHTVGFVFQSYNLIPHQTILSNVELALTISGVSRSERRKRALDALEQVGLREQAHKKPNQMSGGQMQRVAVARALVNNPDILLADEPTGALDSETSIQVMDLLKRIAKDRLVIMVTHNPELAEEYSTRIVKLKDGMIIDDSNPFNISKKTKVEAYRNLGKSSMSLLTAFGLSLNNLLTKKGRTILTAFAGSIGIIGIALILSLSSGFQRYIDQMQEDTLTSYPLTIQEDTADTMGILLSTVIEKDKDKENKDKKIVTETKNLEKMFSSIGKNDMKSFKKYIEDNQEEVDKYTTHINYSYGITPNIYTYNVKGDLTRLNPSSIMNTLTGGMSSSMVGMNMSVFVELDSNKEMLEDDYEIISGKFPKNYDEAVIVLPDENHISDLLLYSLGLKDNTNLDSMITKLMNGESVESTDEVLTYSYEDLLNMDLRVIETANMYRYNSRYNIYENMSEDNDYMANLYNDAIKLRIVGILKPKDNKGMSALMSGVGYSPELTKYIINSAKDKEIVKRQLMDSNINVFNGKRFDDKSNDSGIDFEELISIDTNMLSEAFNVNIDENYIKSLTEGYMEDINNAITVDTSNAKELFHGNLESITKSLLLDMINENPMIGMEGVGTINLNDVDSYVDEYFTRDVVTSKLSDMENKYTIPASAYDAIYKQSIKTFLSSYIMMSSPESEEHVGIFVSDTVNDLVSSFVNSEMILPIEDEFAKNMVEVNMRKTIITKVSELVGKMMESMANAFQVDQNKIAGAFKFNLGEDDIKRIFQAMTASTNTNDANTNLLALGYQDFDKPSAISFYFKDFASKENFLSFLNKYNEKMKKKDEKKVIEYTDITGVMISSVKVIVDSVSYVLIAFVSISLIVSSIMIGIITYISVLERTKEIGILRAIGASKKNISSIFNAETCIIGFLAGIMGVVFSSLLLIPINSIIHAVTSNQNITAYLPSISGVVLIVLSTILTLIGGLIPSRKAAKQDPVLALRSE